MDGQERSDGGQVLGGFHSRRQGWTKAELPQFHPFHRRKKAREGAKSLKYFYDGGCGSS
jgi:hypothetical protein